PQRPAAATLRRYKSNDTTIEKLGELLRENPAGLLIVRDELVGLLASWDREGREGDRAFYLDAWNGNTSFHTARTGRGATSSLATRWPPSGHRHRLPGPTAACACTRGLVAAVPAAGLPGPSQLGPRRPPPRRESARQRLPRGRAAGRIRSGARGC